jgi:FMN reductase
VRAVTVVGNPKPMSRTAAAAEMVVRSITGREPDERIDLAALGGELMNWGSPVVSSAVDRLASADLAVVASPTYKASFTGLLKIFLDHVAAGRLADVTVVPLMLAADPLHALAGEVHLKPVLAELGASCPTPALFLLERDYDQPAAIDPWLKAARPRLLNICRETYTRRGSTEAARQEIHEESRQ